MQKWWESLGFTSLSNENFHFYSPQQIISLLPAFIYWTRGFWSHLFLIILLAVWVPIRKTQLYWSYSWKHTFFNKWWGECLNWYNNKVTFFFLFHLFCMTRCFISCTSLLVFSFFSDENWPILFLSKKT